MSGYQLTRRQILRSGAGVVLTASGLPLLQACAPAATPTAGVIAGTLGLFSWSSALGEREAMMEQFMEENAGVSVAATYFPSPTWQQQLTATFVAGTPIVDAAIIKEEAMAGWISAGFLQSLDDFPGAETYKKEMYPGSLADCSYRGKLFGLPYYTTIVTFVANKKILNAAGISAAPKTWDEVKTQARQIKSAGVLSKPVGIPFKPAGAAGMDWWGLVYASGGSLFNEDNEPVFDGKDPVAKEILERLIDLRVSGLLSVEGENSEVRDAFMAGQSAFASVLEIYVRNLRSGDSKVKDDVVWFDIPSLNGKMAGTSALTRQYVMGSKTKQRDAAWSLVSFMGGKSKKGEYWAPTYLMTNGGLRAGYPKVLEDPEVVKLVNKWYDPATKALVEHQYSLAKPRQAIKETWWAEWDTFSQQQIQNALLGGVSATDALKASADKARKLKAAAR